MRIVYTIILCSLFLLTHSQEKEGFSIYDPEADAAVQISNAVSQAAAEKKHVLIQVGGNWCPWCIKLHKFIESHSRLDSIIQADYVLIRINYSKENKNKPVLQSLGFPQRFGFPVLVILDGSGNRIHTQNTVYLEENSSYNEEKLWEFLRSWNPEALDPKTYRDE